MLDAKKSSPAQTIFYPPGFTSFIPHRAIAASLAISRRRRADSFLARALPPILPSAAACGFFFLVLCVMQIIIAHDLTG